MDFISNRETQQRAMLQEIGVDNVLELFRDIPPSLRLPPPVSDDGISEYEGLQLMETLAEKNHFPFLDNYLGAGAYEHYVPALVSAVCSKSEFLTSYTPYQAEASQGMLQLIFEFQSAICALTGMDVSNASVYDGASACAEALLMALRVQKTRRRILIGHTLHPHYRAVVEQYLHSHDVEIVTIPCKADGRLDFGKFLDLINEDTAAVLVAYPNFFGGIDILQPVISHAKAAGALSIVCANPLIYGVFASAKELGADIAVGDSQPFGIPLQFGGPYVGYIACRQELVRQLPGRIVGETVDSAGRRGFVLTLQAREQHIRREKATSNICTNQALAALANLVAMLWYGKEGIRKLALTNYQRASYLRHRLQAQGASLLSAGPCFNEFAVSFHHPVSEVQKHFRAHGIEPGVDLGRFYSEYSNYLLVAVTETKSKDQLDLYCNVAEGLK